MRLWMALLALGPACGFGGGSNSNPGDDAKMIDAPLSDATPLCFGTYTKICLDAGVDVPDAANWTASLDVNTDLPEECDQHNDHKDSLCVLAHAGITLGLSATLRAHGNKPLVLLSTMPVDLEGMVDVSSDSTLQGAGANPTGMCGGAVAATATSGGAGGSFAAHGGAGEPNGPGNPPTPAAASMVSGFPTTLRGGCAGEPGAKSALVAGGAGGSGGGAVAIIAPSVMVNGKIDASGAGGKGGPLGRSGGGGGGSGGMIVLDVPVGSIVRNGSGALFANGGGGGEGGAGATTTGQDGSSSSAPSSAAVGGGGGGSDGDGGNGGNGSVGTTLVGSAAPATAQNDGGGGAGGGGAGFIYAPGITGPAVISPSSTAVLPMTM